MRRMAYMGAMCTVDSPKSPVAVKPKGKAAAPNKKKTTATTGKLPARKPAATKSAAKAIQSDEEMSDADIEVSIDEDQQQHEATGGPELTQGGKGKKGGKRAAAASKPGSVKAGGAAGTNTCSGVCTRYTNTLQHVAVPRILSMLTC